MVCRMFHFLFARISKDPMDMFPFLKHGDCVVGSFQERRRGEDAELFTRAMTVFVVMVVDYAMKP